MGSMVLPAQARRSLAPKQQGNQRGGGQHIPHKGQPHGLKARVHSLFAENKGDPHITLINTMVP